MPGRGGTLCLAGDCGNCLATVDGVAYVRTCQVAARPGLAVVRHPVDGLPAAARRRRHGCHAHAARRRDPGRAPCRGGRRHRRRIGGSTGRRRGGGGRARRAAPRRRGWPGGRGHLPGPDGRGPHAGRHAACRRRTRSSSPPARPRSSRSAPATTWPASSRPAPRNACMPPAWTSAQAVVVGTPPVGVPAHAVDGALVRFEGHAGRLTAVVTADPVTAAGDDDALSDRDRRVGACAARPPRPHGRPIGAGTSGRGGRRGVRAAACAERPCRRRLPLHGRDRRQPR